MAFEIDRAVNDAQNLDQIMRQEFGAGIILEGASSEDRVSGDTLRSTITRTNTFPKNNGIEAYQATYTAIPASLNIDKLKPSQGYGLMSAEAGGVVPAIISPRSTQAELHILFLVNEVIKPENIGRIGTEPTDIQRGILLGASPYQARSVGDARADNSASTASEGGHTLLGLKALTDQVVRSKLVGGEHVVHKVAKSEVGIVPIFSSPTNGSAGMLSLNDRPVYPNETVVTADDKGIWLIDHPFYEAIGQPDESLGLKPEQLICGIGMVAAKDQLGFDPNDDDKLNENIKFMLGAI